MRERERENRGPTERRERGMSRCVCPPRPCPPSPGYLPSGTCTLFSSSQGPQAPPRPRTRPRTRNPEQPTDPPRLNPGKHRDLLWPQLACPWPRAVRDRAACYPTDRVDPPTSDLNLECIVTTVLSTIVSPFPGHPGKHVYYLYYLHYYGSWSAAEVSRT